MRVVWDCSSRDPVDLARDLIVFYNKHRDQHRLELLCARLISKALHPVFKQICLLVMDVLLSNPHITQMHRFLEYIADSEIASHQPAFFAIAQSKPLPFFANLISRSLNLVWAFDTCAKYILIYKNLNLFIESEFWTRFVLLPNTSHTIYLNQLFDHVGVQMFLDACLGLTLTNELNRTQSLDMLCNFLDTCHELLSNFNLDSRLNYFTCINNLLSNLDISCFEPPDEDQEFLTPSQKNSIAKLTEKPFINSICECLNSATNTVIPLLFNVVCILRDRRMEILSLLLYSDKTILFNTIFTFYSQSQLALLFSSGNLSDINRTYR
jgi:hypothetical protein